MQVELSKEEMDLLVEWAGEYEGSYTTEELDLYNRIVEKFKGRQEVQEAAEKGRNS